ncbi:MAG: response regulator [Kiritimatiellaeota bacterium]|nr:response regulator [Kiritimatiellota bacterium]
MVRQLTRGLGENGFEVRGEVDSRRVMKVVDEFYPDLILLDVDMPHKDGGEVAQELRMHPWYKKIPIIFLTALVERNEARHTHANEDIFLAKPISIAALTEQIGQRLNSKPS